MAVKTKTSITDKRSRRLIERHRKSLRLLIETEDISRIHKTTRWIMIAIATMITKENKRGRKTFLSPVISEFEQAIKVVANIREMNQDADRFFYSLLISIYIDDLEHLSSHGSWPFDP